jgi:phosphatidylserine decarboxylase
VLLSSHVEMYTPLLLLWQAVLVVVLAGSLLLWRFFRDPERVPPAEQNVIVSPADGIVIYVKKVEEGEVPLSDKKGRTFALVDLVGADALSKGGHLIGIAMNYLDVHVNRAPIGGRVRVLKHIKGLYLSLKKRDAILQNERALTVIDNGSFSVGVLQIASRVVRKIVLDMEQGETIGLGERMGMIRFGSQVDLFVPAIPSLQLRISPGARVKAGLSVVATYDDPVSSETGVDATASGP